MGVRDALRMVDSFNKWALRNKERAKDLDDFIHDGLIAAAKRCESCLKDDLGLTFLEDEDSPTDEPVPSGYEVTRSLSEEVESLPLSETPSESTEEMKDGSLDGPLREFTSDFELVEPLPLVDEPSTPEIESEEVTQSEEELDGEKKPSFTWTEYEEAISPAKEDPVMESELDEDDSSSMDEPVSPEPPKVLTPSEEPALPTGELESSLEDGDPLPADLDDPEVTDAPEPITEPPSPPPPPDSDEDEDERRRRARRLFFGD